MSEFDDDIAEDYRNEQAYFNRLSSTPYDPTGKTVARYWRGQDCPDSTTCDVVYIDRLTGKEVMRYDGADPANTRFDYGARPDLYIFADKGLDLKELVDPKDCVVTERECASRMRYSMDDWPDDGDY